MKNHLLLVVLLFGLTVPAAAWAEEEPVAAYGDELFGGGGGYVHPYIAVGGLYDDNIYKTGEETISDYAAVVSPGIWLAVPGTRERRESLKTSTLTPGGLGIVEDRGEEFQRFQAYLHYGAELTRFQDETDNDTDEHRLDALLQFSLKSGITFEVLNIYLDGHDSRGEGAFGELDTFKSNLFGTRISHELSPRFRVRGEYSRFDLSYDLDDNKYLDRADNKFAAFLYYKLSGKSSAFIEYDLVDIGYEQFAERDSQEQTVWGGYRWRLSGRSIGEVKMGYQVKDYAQADLDDSGSLVLKGWLDYQLTGKMLLKLTATRLIEEPDAYSRVSTTANQVRARLSHDMTSKIRSGVEAGYGRVAYDGVYRYRGVTGEREDDEYTGGFFIDYRPQDWLGVKATYTYFDRDSSFPGLSYTDNRVFVSLTLAM